MSYSKFLLGVVFVYLLYYAVNFLYDAFISKKKAGTESEQSFDFGGSHEEEPTDVLDDADEDHDLKKKVIVENKSRLVVHESVEMEIETQGIPLAQLIAEGKQLFAGVAY